MPNNIDTLTQKVYNEGVEKGKIEAEKIISEAEKKSKEIIAKADKEATAIIAKAQKEVKNTEEKVRSELQFSSEQTILALKKQINSLINGSIAQELTGEVMKDKDILVNFLSEIAKKWDFSASGMDISVPKEQQTDFEKNLTKKAQDIIKKGLTITTDSSIDGGFVLSPQDGSYSIDFTDEVFNEFFQSAIKPFTKKILFEK